MNDRLTPAENTTPASKIPGDGAATPPAQALAELQLALIKEVAPAADGAAIVIRAEALRGQQRTELEIAITTDLAPAVAIALLATTAKTRGQRDDLEPALECLAADAAVHGLGDKLRLTLLFDKGALLPVEMPLQAGVQLADRLVQATRNHR